MEKKLFGAATIWTVVGLVGGLFYREFTKFNEFDTVDQFTQLATVHVHSLVLGTVFMLVALLLERTFSLSEGSKRMKLFFFHWNLGLGVTVGMQLVKGSLQALGNPAANHAAIAGMSGLGHIILTLGFIFLLLAIKPTLKESRP